MMNSIYVIFVTLDNILVGNCSFSDDVAFLNGYISCEVYLTDIVFRNF
jgi:hypothetical protein